VRDYELIEKLGEGGMGEVWKAWHSRMKCMRAIKFLHTGGAVSREAAERFLNEAQLQSRMDHPNIVKVVDSFEDNGLDCMVMEFVDGGSLESLLVQQPPRPLPLAQVATISAGVLAALHYAHTLNPPDGPVFHRDVKPSNILIDRQGKARLVDFGIAFAVGGQRRTRVGTALGTVFYMSPEQIKNPSQVDARSDIYSFGCVLYEMLTGHPPFGAETDTDFNIQSMHLERAPVPPRLFDASIPEDLQNIVLCALEKNPDDRFANCFAMARAIGHALPLEEALPGQPPPFEKAPASVVSLGPGESNPIWPPDSAVSTAGPNAVIVDPPQQPPQADDRAKAKKRRHLLWGGVAAAVLPICAFLLFSFLRPPEETVLTLHGSTSVGDELAPRMAEAFLRDHLKATKTGSYVASKDAAGHPHLRVWGAVPGKWRRQVIEIYATGSGDAFKCLAAESGPDFCDIGMASRPFNDQDRQKYPVLANLGSATTEHIVALDGIAVIVNPANPVTRLSIQQLSAICTGRIRNWRDVGGNNAPIVLFGRDQKSGTGEMFAQMVCGKDAQGHVRTPAVSPGHQVDGSGTMVDAVMGESGSLGYVSSPLVKGAKALAVSDGNSAALRPTELSIVTEDYPITRRLFLYDRSSPSAMVQAFIQYAGEKEGQAVVAEASYVGLMPKVFPAGEISPLAPLDYQRIAASYSKLGMSFRFASGNANVGKNADSQLDNLARDNVSRLEAYLVQHNGTGNDIVLIGFTDNIQGSVPNAILARNRAMGVAEALATEDVRVPQSQIQGFGAELPVASNETPEGRGRNRRVEIWVRNGLL
jgi:phosphate transport system substrate-binding protein